MTTITLSAACDRQQVAAEVSSQRTVEWTIQVSNAARPERAPLNIALIIDRSGSMSGEKLRYVQQAACHVIDQLDNRDRVALVAYDDQVTLVAPSTPIDSTTRTHLKAKINELQPGGWTDLSGGWLTGCQEIARQLSVQSVSRALLLTDGLANRGITDIEELIDHARQLRKRGVATSTFGVGLDFNEHLLEALAEQGGGRFFFIERPDQIPAVFRQELGDLLTVVARETVFSLRIPSGVAVEVLGDLAQERDGDRLRVFFGDLCAGEQRTFYTRVLTPPDAPGTSVTLRANLGYANLDGRFAETNAELAFIAVREAEVMRFPANEEVLARASEVELAVAATSALKLERAGRRQEAQDLLRASIAAAPVMAAPAAAPYAKLAEQMSEELSEQERKQAHFGAYKAQRRK